METITAIGSKKHHRFTLNVLEDSTSVVENKSYLSFTFQISKYSGKYDWRSWGTAISYTITIDTNTYTGYIPNYDGTSTVTLKSGSGIEIAHNSDGTKTINIAFNVTDTSGQTYTSGNASASSTMELTTLHTSPLITDINVVEINPLVEGIDNLDMARYLSIKRYTLTAEAYDGATISKYRIYNGNQLLIEKSSTDTNPNVLTVDYANVELQTNTYEGSLYAIVTFEVEDSLGAKRSFTYDNYFPIIPYDLPNIITTSSTIKRNGQSTGQVNLNLTATFTPGTIGITTNNINTMTLQFAYWEKSDTESTTYYTIPTSAISINNNNLTISNWTMTKNGVLVEDVGTKAYYFKIKFEDAFGKISVVQLLCSSSEYLMCKYKDRVDFMKITQKKISINSTMTLALTSNQTVSAAEEKIQLSLYNSYGEGLEYSNYGIKIGDNVSKVLISANLQNVWNSPSSADFLLYIKKNNTNIIRVNSNKNVSNVSTSATLNPVLIDVAKDDVLYLYYQGTSSGSVIYAGAGTLSTAMTIQVVN